MPQSILSSARTAVESGLFLAAEHAVYSNLAPVMSVSFGECEGDLDQANGFLSNLWEQAAAQGITVMVSSGDSGSAGGDNENTEEYATNGLAVNGLASTLTTSPWAERTSITAITARVSQP